MEKKDIEKFLKPFIGLDSLSIARIKMFWDDWKVLSKRNHDRKRIEHLKRIKWEKVLDKPYYLGKMKEKYKKKDVVPKRK